MIGVRALLLLTALAASAVAIAPAGAKKAPPSGAPSASAPQGMRWIPAGEFSMGTDSPNSLPNERPAHRVRLQGFWIDETPVTNAQFTRFVEATGYKTTAERKPVWRS
jgi:formylglycine-generating enzyme required for sulfatase activity